MFNIFGRLLAWWHKRGYRARSKAWRKVRQNHLVRHPACAACGNRAYLEVHHIKPFHTNPDLELHPENLITLCETKTHGIRNCHYTFGHAYNWKGHNPQVITDAADFFKKVQLSAKLATQTPNRPFKWLGLG